MILNQSIGKEFGHVAGADGGEVVDLVAATGAGRDDYGAVGLASDGVGERFGDFQ